MGYTKKIILDLELELVAHIDAMNAMAQKEMDETPGLWIGKLTNDPKHWAEYGVYSVSALELYLEREYLHNLEKEERANA